MLGSLREQSRYSYSYRGYTIIAEQGHGYWHAYVVGLKSQFCRHKVRVNAVNEMRAVIDGMELP